MKCAMVQSDILEAISDLFKAKKDDSASAGADSAADNALPEDSSIRAESPDMPAIDAPAAATDPVTAVPADSTALAGLGKISPLAVLKEIRRVRGLTKAKV
jgi:hypothetical protein